MGNSVLVLAIIACLLGCASVAHAETEVRVATYNIKFLNANVGDDRLAKIQEVTRLLEADIIAIQQIDDRAALRRIWNTTANTQVGPKVSYTGSQAKAGATVLVGSG